MQSRCATSVCLALVVLQTISLINSTSAYLPDYYKKQIARIQPDVQRLLDYILRGNGRGLTFDRLAELGDNYGNRLTGTEDLEKAITFVLNNLTQENFTHVHGENVTVPRWTRGREYVEMLTPRYQLMPILGLGKSVGTVNNSSCNCIEAEAVVVQSFEHLNSLDNETVFGKIVVYNVPWQGSYGKTVMYRGNGALEAAKRGAVAALIRSITPFSIASPHTGVQAANVSIPGACITVEDAEMLQRIYDRGTPPKLRLYMEATVGEDTISRNIVAELQGSDFPNETVIIGGHIDAWDTGTGSMDDGGGCMIAWQALSTLKALNLRPRRTIRLVLWTAEEQEALGGQNYFNDHQNEINHVSLVIESDVGAFKPRGIKFTGNQTAQLIMREILETMLHTINATELIDDGASSDTYQWVERGVPGVELYSYNQEYFFFHHSHGDTMSVLNRDDLDLCTTLWATIAYTVASLDTLLPRINCPELGSQICGTESSTSVSTLCRADLGWLLLMTMLSLLLPFNRFNRQMA